MSDEPKPRNDVTKVSHSTRFGAESGLSPSEAGRISTEKHGSPASVRQALRRLASLEVEFGKSPQPEQISKIFGCETGKATMAQMLAFRKFTRAIKDGDVKAMQQIEDSLDGKLPTTNVNAETSLADLISAARRGMRDEGSD